MVSQCKANYAMADIKGLKLKHKVSNGYLSGNKSSEVIECLKSEKEVKL